VFSPLLLTGLRLWCLTPLSTIFQLPGISGRSVLLVKETELSGEKPLNLPQINDKLYHIMLYPVHFAMSEIRTHKFSDDRQ
jgi:hypothetical protein